MGSGKGSPEHWVAVVKPGRVMFELAGVPEPLAREAIRLAAMKLPVRPSSSSGRVISLKASEIRELTDDELAPKLDEGRPGAVQPAVPARHRGAREHRPAASGQASRSRGC